MVSVGGSDQQQQSQSYVFRGQEPYLLDVYNKGKWLSETQRPGAQDTAQFYKDYFTPQINLALQGAKGTLGQQGNVLSALQQGPNPAMNTFSALTQLGAGPAQSTLSRLQGNLTQGDPAMGTYNSLMNPYRSAAMGTLESLEAGGLNPYLKGMVKSASNVLTDELRRNLLPSINAGGNAANPYGGGGSRQGIAEGLAVSDANRQLADFAQNVYGQAYDSDQARRLAAAQSVADIENAQRNLRLGAAQARTGALQSEYGRQLAAAQSYADVENARNQLRLGAAQSYADTILNSAQAQNQTQQNLVNLLTGGSQALLNLGLSPYQQAWNQLLNYKQLVSDPAILQSMSGSGGSSDFGIL